MKNLVVVRFSVKEWADREGITIEELEQDFNKKPVAFFSNDDSATAGVEYEDGTFGSFGCGQDYDGLTYDEMCDAVECGM